MGTFLIDEKTESERAGGRQRVEVISVLKSLGFMEDSHGRGR